MQPAGPEDKGVGSDQRVCRRTAVAVLLVAAVLVATGTGLGGDFPGAITLNAGIATSFVIEIVNHLGLEVHSVRLRRPDSMWATTIADITEFQLEISATLDVLPFGGGKFGLIKATLGSAIMHLDFEGENLGTFQSQPLQLGGGGKIDSILEGKLHVAPDQKEAFQKIAWATVHRDTITLEIWSEVTVELRGVENGCLLGKVFCSSAGTFTIPHVKFAKSLSLRAANGFGVTLSNLRLSDTPLTIAADDALIEIDCVIDNPSSFELMDLDEIFLDVHTDLNMTMEMMVALGPRFAQVYTEPGFHLLRGRNLKTTVRGHLYAPSREHELVGAAGVFDSFVANSSTSLIALIAGSSQPFYAAAATNVLVRVSLPGIMWPGMSTFQVSNLEHAEPASSRGTLLGQYDNKLEDDAGAIIEMVQIDFNIPVAIATLAGSGLFGSSGCLEQYVRLTLKNPVLILGIAAEIYYDGVDIGGVDLPGLGEDSVLMEGYQRTVTYQWFPVVIDCNSPAVVSALIKLLHKMASYEASGGSTGGGEPALAHVEATIKLRVGGEHVEPFVKYNQMKVPVVLGYHRRD